MNKWQLLIVNEEFVPRPIMIHRINTILKREVQNETNLLESMILEVTKDSHFPVRLWITDDELLLLLLKFNITERKRINDTDTNSSSD